MINLQNETKIINKIYAKKLNDKHKICTEQPLSFEKSLDYFMLYIQQMRDNVIFSPKLQNNTELAGTLAAAIIEYNAYKQCEYLIERDSAKGDTDTLNKYYAASATHWKNLFKIITDNMEGWVAIHGRNI